MVRKTVRILSLLSLIGLLVTATYWFMQRSGPIPICSGPRYLGVTWYMERPPGSPSEASWYMDLPPAFKERPSGFWAVEIPKSQLPPLLPTTSLLVGVADGYLDICTAYYYTVPDRATSPANVLVDASHAEVIRIPLWIIAACFTLLPGYTLGFDRFWLRRRRRLRSATGLCETCGYNLTGNESGVCPECGNRK